MFRLEVVWVLSRTMVVVIIIVIVFVEWLNLPLGVYEIATLA